MDGADGALPFLCTLTWSPLFLLHVSSVCRQGSTKSNYRLFSQPLLSLRGAEWYMRLHLAVSRRSDCQEFELLLTFCSALLHPSRIDCCLTSCSSAGWQLSQNNYLFCYRSLLGTSGTLTTELYWHSVETVGKANWNRLEWGMVICSRSYSKNSVTKC